MRYLRRLYAVSPEARELLVAALWEGGTLGLEERDGGAGSEPGELVAWFAEGAAAPADLPPGAALLAEELVEAEDWLAPYRRLAQPLAIGERLWVDPREPAAPALPVPAGRLPLRVPARTAFGTGSHASTRLALRLLERLPVAGARLLDVGTGSGILALAGLMLGAKRAVACDLDLAAALLAGQHGRLNLPRRRQTSLLCWAGSLAGLAGPARFDLVLANALPHELHPERARLAAALLPAGRLVVSGVPAAESEEVLAGWREHGLRAESELAEEGWVAWVLAPTAAEPTRATVLVSPAELAGEALRLEGDRYRHLFRARRLAVGDGLRLVDGEGRARRATVAAVDRRGARLRLAGAAATREPEREVFLLVAPPRPERAAWLVEKATELGVAAVRFLAAEHAVRQLGPRDLARLRRVAAAALEQCGGARLPEISGPHRPEELVALLADAPAVVLDPAAARPLAGCAAETTTVWIGPEGGWSDGERAWFTARGLRAVSLGSRVLRVETAAVSAAALLLLGRLGAADPQAGGERREVVEE